MDLQNVIFSNGDDFFNDLKQKYNQHSKGYFIMTPSGAGKTYYCKNQTQPDWIDGDDLWLESGAQPPLEYEWWNKGVDVINAVEQRCDVITNEAVKLGFRIMGSVNYAYKPDAIVIPDWELLIERIKHRQHSGNYDGGMTDAHINQLIVHIGIIRDWRIKYDVPEFDSIEKATDYLAKL